MATVISDGIETHYEVIGSGPPLLMFSPGGFDATINKWRTQGIYATIKPLDHLPAGDRLQLHDLDADSALIHVVDHPDLAGRGLRTKLVQRFETIV